MTKILPFRAYRYSAKAGDLSKLVISQSDNKHSADHITKYSLRALVSAEDSKSLFHSWVKQDIIKQDAFPSIYTFQQEYFFEDELILKKGFICKVELDAENLSTILEHEHVVEDGINYQFDLLKKTNLCLHPLMAMYSDLEFKLEDPITESLKNPICTVQNSTGGIDTFGAIENESVIDKFLTLIASKKIFLADGHHRYHASIKYSKIYKDLAGASYMILYLSNMEDQNFKIFPYHRLYNGIEYFNEKEFLVRLSKYFAVEDVEKSDVLVEKLKTQRLSFGVLTRHQHLILTLKKDKESLLMKHINAERHFINFSIIKEKILSKAFDLPVSKTTKYVNYETNLAHCFAEVGKGMAQLAIISPTISPYDLKLIAEKKVVLPEKTTFFFPKAVSGIVFYSMDHA